MRVPYQRIASMIFAMGVLCFCLGNDSLEIRYAAEMTHLPMGSDIVALGETGVVLPRRAVGAAWNPAAAGFQRKYEFSAEFADLYEGLSQHGCIALSVPLAEEVGTSVLFSPFYSGRIERYDTLLAGRDDDIRLRPDGSARSSFTNYQNLIVASAAKKFSRAMPRPAAAGYPLPIEISTGMSFKSFWQTMKPDSVLRMGMSVNLDAGMLVRIGLDYNLRKKEVSREMLVGLSARDFLPSPVIYINSRDEYDPANDYHEEITPSYTGGVAYVDRSGNFGGNWMLLAAVKKRYQTTFHYGIEAEFFDMIAFRAGLSDRTPSVGAGVRYKQYFLDYTFRFDELAYSFIRLAFGIQY